MSGEIKLRLFPCDAERIRKASGYKLPPGTIITLTPYNFTDGSKALLASFRCRRGTDMFFVNLDGSILSEVENIEESDSEV